ncbi:MAG TPA: hypothetical protein VGO93_13450 [Candidatus Xenobia bacterium]
MPKAQYRHAQAELPGRGATILVDVGLPPIKVLPSTMQPQRHKTAIIDTSSELSWVDGPILKALGLTPSIVDVVQTHFGTVETGIFSVAMTVHFDDTPFFIPVIQVCAGQMREVDYKVVLGRNVLRYGVLNYQGSVGTWTLDFADTFTVRGAKDIDF